MLEKYELLRSIVDTARFPYNLAWDVICAGDLAEETRFGENRASIVSRINLATFLERVASLRQQDFDLVCAFYMDSKTFLQIGKENGTAAEDVAKQIQNILNELLHFHHLYWMPTYAEMVSCKDKLAAVSAKYRTLKKQLPGDTEEKQTKAVSLGKVLIEELGLPMRIVLLLRRANIATVRDLCNAAAVGKLMNTTGIGRTTLEAVWEACQEYGIFLNKGVSEEAWMSCAAADGSFTPIVCDEEKLNSVIEQKRAEGCSEEELEQYRQSYLADFRKGVLETLTDVVKNGLLDVSIAAKMAGMSTEEFSKELSA